MSGNRCTCGNRCLFRHSAGEQDFSTRSRKEGTQGAVAMLKKIQFCVSQNSDPMNSILRKARESGLNASAGHTLKFSGCTWYETKIRERKGQFEGIFQKGEHRERNPCASGF